MGSGKKLDLEEEINLDSDMDIDKLDDLNDDEPGCQMDPHLN